MSAPKRGPLERSVRAELTRAKLTPARTGLAMSAVLLAQRIDDLPEAREETRCPDCGEGVWASTGLDAGDLSALARELRMTMTRLLGEGDRGADPLAALAARFGQAIGGTPLGHPETIPPP